MTDVTPERGAIYGDFFGHALAAQEIKAVMRNALENNPRYFAMPHETRVVLLEGLEMIAHKIGRIVNGDPTYLDNFIDIEGYSKITRERVCVKGDKNA